MNDFILIPYITSVARSVIIVVVVVISELNFENCYFIVCAFLIRKYMLPIITVSIVWPPNV